MILALEKSIPNVKMFSHDITQVYTQIRSNLERDLLFQAPSEMVLPENTVLRVVKPIYGIPEAGFHWYITYLAHHIDTLQIRRSRTYPFLLIKRSNGSLRGLIALQVDDILGLGTPGFLNQEETASQKFLTKTRTYMEAQPIEFNGINITEYTDNISISQFKKIEKLSQSRNQKQLDSVCALIQYIAVRTLPDACAPAQLLASGAQYSPLQVYK